MKPNSGTSGGLGFIKLEYNDGVIIENNKVIDFSRFEQIKNNMKNYIVTEYAYQHKDLAKIWGSSECTLRVIMIKNAKKTLYRFDRCNGTCSRCYNTVLFSFGSC